jgi:hypothetical protein
MAAPWASSDSVSLGGDGGTVTLVDESAFCISEASGDVRADAPHGFIFRDTRFVSEFCVLVNGVAPEPLAATTLDPFCGVFVLRDRPRAGRADSTLLVERRRFVGSGMREDVVVRNFGRESAYCELELLLGADFAGLFDVKEGHVKVVAGPGVPVGDRRITFDAGRSRANRGS